MSSSINTALSPPPPRSLPWTKAEADQEYERRRCAADVCYWLDTYGWTYDPRLVAEGREPFLPFKLYPRQIEFLEWLRERERLQEDGLGEKSRDVGFTYLCAGYALHGWLFRPGFSAGFGSRKLELVDRRGEPKSIFEKLRIMYRRLPKWQMPAGFKESEHDLTALLKNPQNGATIGGEGGDDIGRGDRRLIYFIDEAAHLDHPDKIDAALSQTTRCRIYISTPCGPGNPFAKKRFSGKISVFTFRWQDDPRKGEAWYASECARLDDPVIIAQELDIDYSASIEGIVIPARWVRAAVNFPLPEGMPAVAGLDVADEKGSAKNVFVVRRGPVVLPPVAWMHVDTTQTAHRAADLAEAAGVGAVNYDCIGVGAGIRGTLNSSGRKLAFKPHAINFNGSPSETRWPDGHTSKERFRNKRAELWWLLRTRFEKTWEHREKGVAHPPEEMISIPDDPELIADLSLPLYEHTEGGKVQLESKESMRRRGVRSPDHGDALANTMEPLLWWQDPATRERQMARAGQPRPVEGQERPSKISLVEALKARR